ncbi:(Fe-S)-binding protein [Desulfocurvus sp.]|uniref:(Fe-S)-binding protein n=1 Tax=Desulfocurvus sp. TaxID=2871698 RepID=UPI0025C52935|nr:(Fe-S)-binding protein [Desulfocurvus sp.]MCK9239095.1 (Fe-S)-binding protein [Desulfocurvus sp.]
MDSPARPQEPQCILCGRCLEVCPLLAATGREELSPRAKLFLLQRLGAAQGALDARGVERLAGLCLSCGRCSRACPQRLDVPAAVARARGRHPGFTAWAWKAWIGGARALWPGAARLGGLLGTRGAPGSTARRLEALVPAAPRPLLRPEAFTPCPDAGKTVLFSGCLGRTLRPAWARTAEALLRGLGCDPGPEPGWGCCGATLGHAGLAAAHSEAVARNVAAWRAAGRPRVATFCASCARGLAAYATDPAAGFDPAEAAAWTRAVTPLSRLLRSVRFAVSPPQGRVLYHAPCHAGADDPDRAWLASLAGLAADTGDGRDCCGLGGIMQLGSPDLSRAVAARLWQRRAALPGDLMLSGCSGCLTQLAATAPGGVVVAHWLDCIDIS